VTPAGCRQSPEGAALANSLRSWHRTGHHALSGQVTTPKATNSGISPAHYPDMDLRTSADHIGSGHNAPAGPADPSGANERHAAGEYVLARGGHHAAHTGGMPVRLRHIVIDAHDLPGLARFWTQAPGWKILSGRENEMVIGTGENAPAGICFMPVTDPRTVKNRVHADLAASAADRDRETGRLLALGARRAGIGQAGAESWTVLADPEGNEFCVVRPKETLIS